MKKYIVAMAVCFLFVGSSVMAAPSAADQKWLTAVQKMVEEGQTKVSTPSEERVKLLEGWASNQGFSPEVSKTDTGFSVEVHKKVAKN